MKRLYAAISLGTILSLSLALAACGGDETGTTDGFSLHLDAGEGGSLAQTEYSLPVGSSLADFLKDKTPTPEEGLTFAWWDLNGAPLGGETMPEGELTLHAKYMAQYSVSLHLEALSGGYTERSETGSAVYGEPFTYAPAVAHYALEENAENRLSTQALGKNETFTAYLALETLSVHYEAGLPAGENYKELPAGACKYGGSVALADGSAFSPPEMYRFAGWAEERGGKVTHAAGENFTVTAETTLYAVWDKAYTDRFGGSDLIFVPQGEEGKVILHRGGVDFTGELEDELFRFELSGEKTLEGRLYADTFAYFRADVAGTYTLSEGGRLRPERTLLIDDYWNAVYTNGAVETEGRLSYNAEVGDWDLLLEDDTKVFRFRLTEQDGTPAFELGGEEAGEYVVIYFTDMEAGNIDATGEVLFLNGYGGVQFTPAESGTQPEEGSYRVAGSDRWGGLPVYIVEATVGGRELSFYTVPLEGGTSGCVLKDASAGSYPVEGGTLVLDGFGIFAESAVYTAGEVRRTGAYTRRTYRSVGTVVTVGETLSFVLADGSATLLESSDRLPLYELDRVTLTNGGYALADPLLVLYAAEAGEGFLAELYAELPTGGYALAATGVYTEEYLGTNLYLSHFTRTHAEEGYANLPEQFSYLVGGVEFEDATAEAYFLLESDGKKQYQELTSEGEGKIWLSYLPMGSLYYAENGSVYQATVTDLVVHTDLNGRRTFKLTYIDYATMQYTTLDCELLEGDKFVLLDTAPLTLFKTDEFGNTALFASLKLDGKGGALYLPSENAAMQEGSYALQGHTAFGDAIYLVTVGSAKLTVITGTYYDYYSDMEYDVYYVYNEELAGSYESAAGAVLELDGFCYGQFTDEEGISYFGTVFFVEGEEATLSFVSTEGDEFYFRTEGKTLTVLGAEYGSWDFRDENYAALGYTVFFDGEGTLRFEKGEESFEGTYEVTGEYGGYPEALVHVDLGNGPQIFTVSVVNILGIDRYCVPRNDAAVATFVSADWAVLRLDGYGFGTYYAADGSAGRRVIYTLYDAAEGHLRLQFSDDYGSYLSLSVDMEHGTFAPQSYTAASYYADDFSGIRFGADGRLSLLGEVGEYFVDGNVATGYFMQDDATYRAITLFAPAGAEGDYEGKRFRRWDGNAMELAGSIEFRDEEGALMQDHPAISATLTFTPSGEARFTAAATVQTQQAYTGFTFQVSYSGNAVSTQLVYEGTEYPVSFAREGGTLRFTAVGGRRVTVWNDLENTVNSSSSLTLTAFGFGPIERTDPTFTGSLRYGSYELDFTAPFEQLYAAAHDGDGDRNTLLFTVEGKEYALTYYVAEGGYYLYSFAECTRFTAEAGGKSYEVCLLTYLFDRGNYSLLSQAAGEVCGMLLFEEGTLVREASLQRSGGGYILTEYVQEGTGRSFFLAPQRAGDGFGGVNVTEPA